MEGQEGSIFPPEWAEEESSGDACWWRAVTLVPLSLTSAEALFLSQALRRSCPAAVLLSVQRVQQRKLWRDYYRFREEELPTRSIQGQVNEQLLYHGTGDLSPEAALQHPDGLDPRFSSGGFYGRGVYLAEDPAYPIAGRYAHRVPGHSGLRMQLLVVRAALGTPQEMGQRITAETRAMTMPGVRIEGPPRVLYDSVRAGPHRPFVAGDGEAAVDASVIYVVYESRQLYPAYVIEFEVQAEAMVGDALGAEPEAAQPAKRARRASGANVSSQAANPASASPGVSHVMILVKCPSSGNVADLWFKMAPTNAMKKLFDAYCVRTGIDRSRALFSWNRGSILLASQLQEHQTPEELGMRDEDRIIVSLRPI